LGVLDRGGRLCAGRADARHGALVGAVVECRPAGRRSAMRAATAPRLADGPWVSLVSVALLAVFWQLAAGASPAADIPTPLQAAQAAATLLADGTLGRAVLVSWRTVLEGFLI